MLKEEKKQIILDKLSNYGFTDDFTIMDVEKGLLPICQCKCIFSS